MSMNSEIFFFLGKARTFLYQYDFRMSFSSYPDWVIADHAQEIPLVIGMCKKKCYGPSATIVEYFADIHVYVLLELFLLFFFLMASMFTFKMVQENPLSHEA